MSRIIMAMLWRDLRMLLSGGRRGGATLPLLFFLAVAMLYPFAVGPDAPLLARTGGGVDLEAGVFDQLALRGVSEESIVAVRMVAHWLSFGPLLLLATLPASALLGLEGGTLRIVLLGLLAGTPGLAAIGVMIAALTAGLRGGAALSGLLLIPLAVPILIFGAGSLARGDMSGVALCGAISLLLVAITPFAGGAALRAAREG